MVNETSFEMMRHGEKDREGQLTPEGAEKAHERASEIFEKIEKMPKGSIVCFLTSNIQRAQDTKNIIEDKVVSLMQEEPDEYAVIKLGKENVPDKIAEDSEKKFLLKTDFYDQQIGMKPIDETPKEIASTQAFRKYKLNYGKSETVVGKIWVAHKDEMGELEKELKAITPFIPIGEIKPSELAYTPESIVIKQLEWMMAIKKITDQSFPDRDVNIMGVSHNINLDFTMIKLLAGEISLKSLNSLGGKLSRYLESSRITFKDGKMIVNFRDQTKEYADEDLDKIIQELKEEGKEREEEWGQESTD
jgi:hypothetical protein